MRPLSSWLARPGDPVGVRTRLSGLLAVAAVAVTGAVTGVTVLAPGTPASQTLGDLAILAAAVLATYSCYRAARRGGPAARGWATLAVATGLWSLGQLIWAGNGVARDHVYPFPSLADAGYLGFGITAAVALARFPHAGRRLPGVSLSVLDAVVIASSLVFIGWATVLGPIFLAGGGNGGLTRAVSLAYPVVDITLAALVLSLGARVPAGSRRPWLLLGSGILLLAVTDSIYVSMTAAGTTGVTGTPLVAGWVGAFLLVAFAARYPADRGAARRRQLSVLQELLPVAPALAAVVVAAVERFDLHNPVLLGCGGVALVAFTVQQAVAARERVQLASGLEDTVDARTTELRTAEDRFGSLVSSTNEAILSSTTDGIIMSWNPAAERLYGYTEAEVLGRSVDLLIPPEVLEQEASAGERVAGGQVLRQHDTERLRKDGSRVHVALTVSPICSDGRVTGLSAISYDVSERRRHEHELADARTRALAASRAKSDFLATMSHEIRTPMNGVIGLTGLLLETPLDDAQRRYVTGVRGAGEALLAIIDDILDFSKLEAGKVELEDAPFDPRQLVEEIGVLLATGAAAKGLELVATCAPDLPATLRGDAGRLRQVLINLASNAVKFTAHGEVVLRARLCSFAGDRAVVEFSVSDTGIGIDPAESARLFEPFAQADSSTTRRFGGTGLGLAICRRLVTAMGGGLAVDSTVGAGSTFCFRVTLATSSPLPPQPVRPVRLEGLRVLVVDDNATNRMIITEQLVAWNLAADAAVDAASGWRLLQEAVAAGRPYDVAVLDMCMPDQDGVDLAQRMSGTSALSRTRTMILTSAGHVDPERLAAAGVGACVAKPVRSSELYDALQQLVAAHVVPGAGTPSLPSRPSEASRGRVLVVEDNEVNQMVAEGVLRSLGYDVELAWDGRQALSALAVMPYTAVLMDCHMPEMDGYQATVELRRREGAGHRTPVIAMTAGVLAEDRERCTAAGMDDFVAKPVDVAVLDRALARWTDGEAAPEAVEDGGGEPYDVLDPARLAVLRGMGPDDGHGILPMVVEAFVRSAPGELAELQEAERAGDTPTVGTIAHRLRGAAANMGAARLVETCGRLEEAVTSGGAADPPSLAGVEREVAAACRALSGVLAGQP